MERDPVILQIPHCSRKVKGWARFRCFYCIKLITIKRCRGWEIFTGAWGNYYQRLASELAAFSQSDFRSHELLIQFLQER